MILFRHLLIGIGNVNVAAARLPVPPPEHHRNPLMNPQADLGGSIGGNPYSASTKIRFRCDLDYIIFLIGDIALWNLPRKPAKNRCHRFNPHCIFILARAKPMDCIIQQRNECFHIIFAVMLMQHQAGQLYCHLFFLLLAGRIYHPRFPLPSIARSSRHALAWRLRFHMP